MEPKKIILPDGVQFADLKLEREPVTKRLLYRAGPLHALAVANGIDQQTLFADDDDWAALLVAEWYRAHRQAGGDPDPVAEQVLAEVAAQQASENVAGKGAGKSGSSNRS